jgi:hypothetical protein
MRLHHATAFLFATLLTSAATASEMSWMFQPGYYTHSPVTGKRVAQYEPEKPSYVVVDPTYQESGYRHQLIQNGTEWLNLVQTWGAGTAIRPYGEWEYPYRAGATPYGPWGNPQGPWTLPFDSWQNPFAVNRWPSYCPWRPGYGGNGQYDNGRWQSGNGWGSQGGNGGWQPWSQSVPQSLPAGGMMAAPGGVGAPPPGPPGPQGQGL